MGHTHNKVLRISAASLLAGIGCLALTQPSYAASEGTFTDNNSTEWKYSYDTSGDDPVLTIGFKSAANTTNTIFTIPSLTEVKGKLSSLSGINSIDTYHIRNLATESEASAAVAPALTKVDMTNAAKVQISDLAPLFKNSQNSEIELVFGNDMVIGNSEYVDYLTTQSSFNYVIDADAYPGLFEGLKVKLTNLDKVKYIGWRAFKDATLNESNTAITINSNQTVGGRVFENSNVKSLSINTSKVGFGFCKGCSSLTSLTLGNSVTEIYGQAFQNTSNLKQTLDTNKVTEIDRDAFHNSGLTGLTVHNDLAYIREYAFEGTTLGELNFTGTNPSIGVRSFYNAGITSLNLGENLTTIQAVAFGKNKIKNLVMPKSITSLGPGLFMQNPLDTLTINYDVNMVSGYTPARVTYGCIKSWSDDIPVCSNPSKEDSMINLKHLILNAPYEPATAQDRVYSDSYLSDLRNHVKNIIPGGAFADLDGLESVVIGEGYEYIGSRAFMRGSSSMLNSSYCPVYAEQCVRNSNGEVLTTLSLPESLIAMEENAFMWFSNNRNMVIDKLPSNLEYIGNQAFFMNAGTIKDLNSTKLKYLGDRAFGVGLKVEKAYIGDSLAYIGHGAFSGNYGYMDLTIDTDIYDGRLKGRTSSDTGSFFESFGMWFTSKYLDSLSFPDGFTLPSENSSPDNHLHHYKKLTFTNKVTTIPTNYGNFIEGLYCDTIDMSALNLTTLPNFTFLFVKANEVKLPNGLVEIGAGGLQAAEIEEELILPSTLKTIGALAFMAEANGRTQGNIKITSLPNSIESIGHAAFYNQSRVKLDLNLPNLKTLGSASFMGTSVRDVTLGSNIESIDPFIFYRTPKLRNITIDRNLFSSSNRTSGWEVIAWAFGGDEGHQFGTIKLTSNAGQPCGGYGNCDQLVDYNNDPVVCYAQDDGSTVIDCNKYYAQFYGIKARRVDLSEMQNVTTIPASMFQDSTIGEVILPDTVKTIGEDAFYQARIGKMNLPSSVETIDDEAFQWSYGNLELLPDSIKTVGRSAFFGADLTDDVYIPASIESIGADAFNGGDADVYYDTVTIAGDINETITNDQLVHQMFWNTDIHTLVINSSTLPSTTGNGDVKQFWNMPMEEVVITSLPAIPDNAFEANSNLKLLVMRRDNALRSIGEEAFLDCEKLYDVKFASGLANETVTLGKNAFSNTGFKTIGNDDAQFELNAAKFDASAGYTFANMKQLTNVYVPENFNNAVVPEGAFANASELVEVIVAPGVDKVKNAAFGNANKLERIIFWGDTIIEDSTLAGYVAPTRGGVSSLSAATIPASTDIYAYSTSKAKAYADSRSGDGEFYPLDEVLYITTDKYRISQPVDEDFGGDVTVYALRRDGIVMESDTWGEYDGTAYARDSKDLYFMHEAATVDADPAFGTVFETPVSINDLDFSNENFTNISYTVGDADEDGNRYTTIDYTDGLTNNVASTSVLLRAPVLRAAPAATAVPQQTGGSGEGEGQTGTTSNSGTTNNSGSTTANSGSANSSSTAANSGSTTNGNAANNSGATNSGTQSGSNQSSSLPVGGSGEGEGQTGTGNSGTTNNSGTAATTGNANSGSANSGSTAANSGSNESTAAATGSNSAATTGASESATTTAKTSENGNPKTGDTILGYVALLGSCSLFAGAAFAIIRRNRR